MIENTMTLIPDYGLYVWLCFLTTLGLFVAHMLQAFLEKRNMVQRVKQKPILSGRTSRNQQSSACEQFSE